ncbi:hypothetical protein BDZ45DRAFT_694631 [Acephala macrosclerotiorum]|nr:hypothetical protein BDZ45DRAFT_694631 [Acephala macrosclerotiorum]
MSEAANSVEGMEISTTIGRTPAIFVSGIHKATTPYTTIKTPDKVVVPQTREVVVGTRVDKDVIKVEAAEDNVLVEDDVEEAVDETSAVVVQVVKVSGVPEHEVDEIDEYISWSHGKVPEVIQVALVGLPRFTELSRSSHILCDKTQLMYGIQYEDPANTSLGLDTPGFRSGIILASVSLRAISTSQKLLPTPATHPPTVDDAARRADDGAWSHGLLA